MPTVSSWKQKFIVYSAPTKPSVSKLEFTFSQASISSSCSSSTLCLLIAFHVPHSCLILNRGSCLHGLPYVASFLIDVRPGPDPFI